MVFKNPTLLWALLFLAIPILVHLFQLRRFKKVAFTNVAFLKPLISQTRKSRTIKKWLTLLTRLCAVACIVLAFAQPFIPGSKTAIKEKETSIYLDNSFSMQREAANGSLLQQSVQQLIETIPSSKSFNLITNDSEFKNVTLKEVKNNLLDLNYSKNHLI
ncbi:BatA domain-containing protein [Nonlabens tegetincola]|uniref:BatA domain-containing protein n=1 Tax=Nonlabens tegetincola TaxID=323273 RepID=UPI000A26BAFD|nr:BatA domain-containing protein [Nonlabens tegetincola]